MFRWSYEAPAKSSLAYCLSIILKKDKRTIKITLDPEIFLLWMNGDQMTIIPLTSIFSLSHCLPMPCLQPCLLMKNDKQSSILKIRKNSQNSTNQFYWNISMLFYKGLGPTLMSIQAEAKAAWVMTSTLIILPSPFRSNLIQTIASRLTSISVPE